MPNNYLPATYQPYGYSGVGQQMYPQYQMPVQQTQQQTQTVSPGLIWVDGEVGAKAFQMPAGWPCNQPIALWDTNDTIIYLKSTNQMGMPNPLQKAHYTLEEQRSASRMSRDTELEPKHDMSEYVRKDDMESMKHELMEMINGIGTTSTATRRTSAKGE